MVKKLTLGGLKAPKTQAKPVGKPVPSDKDKQAFLDCGLIIRLLYKQGIKPKWRRPLSKGIYQELRKLIPKETLSSKRLNNAIRHHVKSPGYLLLIREGTQRYNILGKPDGRVSSSESRHALEELYAHHGGLMRDRRKRKNKPITSNRKRHVRKT